MEQAITDQENTSAGLRQQIQTVRAEVLHASKEIAIASTFEKPSQLHGVTRNQLGNSIEAQAPLEPVHSRKSSESGIESVEIGSQSLYQPATRSSNLKKGKPGKKASFPRIPSPKAITPFPEQSSLPRKTLLAFGKYLLQFQNHANVLQ